MAAYPDPPHIVSDPESIAAQAAYVTVDSEVAASSSKYVRSGRKFKLNHDFDVLG
jgi:hypothetical protein